MYADGIVTGIFAIIALIAYIVAKVKLRRAKKEKNFLGIVSSYCDVHNIPFEYDKRQGVVSFDYERNSFTATDYNGPTLAMSRIFFIPESRKEFESELRSMQLPQGIRLEIEQNPDETVASLSTSVDMASVEKIESEILAKATILAQSRDMIQQQFQSYCREIISRENLTASSISAIY